jgi:hypothetical protein
MEGRKDPGSIHFLGADLLAPDGSVFFAIRMSELGLAAALGVAYSRGMSGAFGYGGELGDLQGAKVEFSANLDRRVRAPMEPEWMTLFER